MANKIDQQDFLLPHRHFIGHLLSMPENPPRKHREKLGKTRAFDPVAQEQDWLPPRTTLTKLEYASLLHGKIQNQAKQKQALSRD
jgi:hypothetical protein